MKKPYWVIPENLVAVIHIEKMHDTEIIRELNEKYWQVAWYNLYSTLGIPFIEYYKLK